MIATIYKILTRAEWQAAQAAGVYHGSAHDARDGFIHFSTAAQLVETARKHFSGIPDLVLLAVDISRLSWPPSEAAIQSAPSDSLDRGLDGRVKPGHYNEGRGGHDNEALRWEPSRGGELFPHLYADLPVSAVTAVCALPLDENGIPILPSDLAS